MVTTFDVAAQFGGPDAAQVMVPHWRALKLAAAEADFSSVPLKNITFILRVDGAVNTYDQSGAGRLKVDKKGAGVSVDIGLTRGDLAGRGPIDISEVIAKAIVSSADLLANHRSPHLKNVDWELVRLNLQKFVAAYRVHVKKDVLRSERTG